MHNNMHPEFLMSTASL